MLRFFFNNPCFHQPHSISSQRNSGSSSRNRRRHRSLNGSRSSFRPRSRGSRREYGYNLPLAPSTGNPLSIGSAGLKFSDGTTQTTAAQSGKWSTTSTGIYYNGGDVGVGVSSPGYKLDVAGAINLNNGIGTAQALFVNGKEALWSNGTYFSWGYANSYNYFADPIAIGSTASPPTPLEITYNTGSGTEGDLLRLNSVSGSTGNGPGILFTNNGDVLELARIAGLDSGNWGGGLAFYTSPGTGSSPGGTPTERMSINDSGQVTVGMGGPSTGNGAILNVSGGGDTVLASGGSLFFDGNYSYATGNYIRPLSANNQDFYTSGALRMGINSGGQVGVNNQGAITGVSSIFNITASASESTGLAIADSGGSLAFALNPGQPSTGNWEMYDHTGGSWTWDMSASSGDVSFNGPVTFDSGINSLNGNNINDVTGGVSIGNVSTGWYSDTSNLSARYPGASGCFYVQNSGGGTTNLTSGACNANGGTVVYGPLTSQGLLVAGSNMAGGTDEFHITNTTGNAYLYAYSTGSTSATIGAWSSGGAVPLVIGGSGLELNGVTRSSWPGSLAARSTFGTTYSGDSATYGGVTANPLELASASITTNSTTNIYISGYSNYVSNWSCGGTADFYLTLDGTQYANVTSLFVGNNNFGGNGATVTDIIPSVAAGTHTVGFWISNGAYSTSCADVTVEPGAVSIMAF